MKIRSLLIIAVILTQIPGVYADEEYHHVFTLESPTPIQDGRFGSDIALSGNRLLVGETGAKIDNKSEAGRAYLFDTAWKLIANLTPTTPKTGAGFSRSLDIKGDILVVSSYRADIGNMVSAGEVQVYDSSGSPLYVLHSVQPIPLCKFGRELAIGNGIILVGHCPATSGCRGTVAVYDLEQNYLTTLTGEPLLKSVAGEELAANDEFIFVGGTTSIGSFFVFDYNWNLVKTLQSPEPDTNTNYGGSVAINGNYFVVGESGATVDEYESAGRAYVYDTDWNLVSTLQSPTPEADAEFGIDVSIAGDLVVVGEGKGDVTNGDEGKVYVFNLNGNLLDVIVSPEPEMGAQFGYNVLTDGELLIVSEVDATVDEISRAGKVHVFRLGEYTVEETTPVAEEEPETEDTGGWIPGFPLITLALGLLCTTIFLTQRKR